MSEDLEVMNLYKVAASGTGSWNAYGSISTAVQDIADDEVYVRMFHGLYIALLNAREQVGEQNVINTLKVLADQEVLEITITSKMRPQSLTIYNSKDCQ